MVSGKQNSSLKKKCEQCDALFKYKPSEAMRGHARFCSKACQNTWQSNTRVGEVHSYWKGDDVGYSALHSWVYRKLGNPRKCENCGKDGLTGSSIHWANISGDYHRDLDDWARLCASCHKHYDKGNIILSLQGVI